MSSDHSGSNGDLADECEATEELTLKEKSGEEKSFSSVQSTTASGGDESQHSGKASSIETGCSQYGGRLSLPAPTVKRDISLLQLLKQSIGKDLSTISMPIVLNEPMGFLQRCAEHFEYYKLILDALEHSDKLKRIELIAAFAVSNGAASANRFKKPFNPLLGETYEFRRKATGDLLFIAEQVSHHPPISAYSCEVPGKFKFSGWMEPRVHFRGRHLDVTPNGIMTLELIGRGEVYTWESPRMNVHNLVFGKTWLEIYGDLVVTNHTNQCRAVVTYKRSRWLGKVCRKLEGFVYDENNTPVRALYGNWTECLCSMPLDSCKKDQTTSKESSLSSLYTIFHRHVTRSSSASNCEQPERTSSAKSYDSATCTLVEGHTLLWRPNELKEHNTTFYNFGDLALTLNELTLEEADMNLPPTDSRFRMDIRLLENGDVDGAASEKRRLEEKQQTALRSRKRHNQEWKPLWFVLVDHPYLGKPTWTPNEKYDERQWNACPDIF